jgi:hypothetical protein
MRAYTIAAVFRLALEPRHVLSSTPESVLNDIVTDAGAFVDIDAVIAEQPPEVRPLLEKGDIASEWSSLTADDLSRLLRGVHEHWQEFNDVVFAELILDGNPLAKSLSVPLSLIRIG